MGFEYKVLKEDVSAQIVEKRSKFVACLSFVQTCTEARNFIDRVTKKNFAAKHNVYAYSLFSGESKFSDDGEPSGTAGKPEAYF